MKKILTFVAIIAAIIFSTVKLNASDLPEANGPGSEPRISLDFQDARLKDVLKAFSMQSGLNFIASEAVQDRTVTLYLDDVPLEMAMDKIFKANNLTYELDKEAKIFIVKDWGKLQAETQTKVFYLKHATVSSSSLKEEESNNLGGGSADTESMTSGAYSSYSSSASNSSSGSSSSSGKWKIEGSSGITSVVKNLLSPGGSVIEDFRTNSLIVTDSPARMATISQVIASLDISVPQIMLEVEMLDVSKNALDKMGIKYQENMDASLFTAVIEGAVAGTGFPMTGLFNDKRVALTPGSITYGTNSTAFDFIKQITDAKVLARPRIMTLNNETAEIKITTNEAIGTITDTIGQGAASTTTTSAERVETGVSLRVTPQINAENGEITMFLFPRVRDATPSTFNTDYKDPEERSTKSIVRIKDGETVVIGGLIRHDRSETLTKIPVLGDIPLLGGLFRHKNKDKDKERELLVFITPRIIKNNDIKAAQAQRITLPIREQGTVPGINRDYLVNASLNNFDKKSK